MPYNLTSSDIKSAIFSVSFKSKIGISRPGIGESEAIPLIDELVITSGKEFLNTYKWNTKIAEHYFCKVCGINTHHKRRSDPKQYGYNIGCIEGFEMSWIENAPFVDNTKMSVIDKFKE